ncbi:F-box protein GID2 isoform X2 [Oryza brachyantha]|uniref:F-box protein GID2 isoform X2 n=1 Tax=Oryza brachyantha TaxID=4533 RepID=UPI00077611A4|nr:F-box protein GID2 isoform X2 [Oryza brachyantha]
MKLRADSSGGDEQRAPAAGDGDGGGGCGEPAKRQRTDPSSSSSHGEASSSSQPPPQQQEEEEAGQPPEDAGEGEQPRVPDLGEDLVFEVLRRAEARTLAVAACVSRGWRQLAEDERLWEAACVREWANLGFSEQQLRAVVLSLGGFRRLHAVYIRPVQRRGAGVPRQQGRRQLPVRLGRDQVQLSLSLFSIGFFQNMPGPPPRKKDEGNDSDKNGGGKCG